MALLGVDGQWTIVDFIVDTGAYVVTMPASAASMLGLNLKNGIPSTLIGVDGSPIQVYTLQIQVEIPNLGVRTIPIAFSTFESPTLVGWYGFLQTFHSIIFDNDSKELVFS